MTLCMPISPAGLLHGHIDPVLRHLATYHNAMCSDDARAMMLRVAAAESELQWLEQHRGPARSYWQIEPASALDVLRQVPRGLHELLHPLVTRGNSLPSALDLRHVLTWNPWAGAAIGRAYWWIRDPEPMPPWQAVDFAAARWKLRWNTYLGAGTVEGFLAKCHECGVESYIAQTFGGANA